MTEAEFNQACTKPGLPCNKPGLRQSSTRTETGLNLDYNWTKSVLNQEPD